MQLHANEYSIYLLEKKEAILLIPKTKSSTQTQKVKKQSDNAKTLPKCSIIYRDYGPTADGQLKK